MKRNIWKFDKSVRLLLAVIFALAGLYVQSWWGLPAIVPLLTGAASFCPLYSLFGINTCDVRKA